MKIKLVKKTFQEDKQPLIILMKEPEMFCKEVKVGQSIEVDDEMAYAIMGDKRYKGMFEQEGYEAKSGINTYGNKGLKAKIQEAAKANTPA